VQPHVKHFCDAYASTVMREVQRKVVREMEVEEKKAASFYMNIYYVAEQSAKEAEVFLQRIDNFFQGLESNQILTKCKSSALDFSNLCKR